MGIHTKKAIKTVSVITIAILAAKVLGMMRDIVFAHLYGTSMQSDAFLSASRIPLLFFDLTLGAAVLSTFIPVFNRHLQTDRKKAFQFANTFLNIILLISGTFCVLGMVFAQQLARAFAPGLSVESIDLATKLLVIMLPTAVFTAAAYVFVGILQSLDEFTIPAIISLVSNGGVIIYLLFFNQYFGIYGMAVALLIAWSLQILVQVPSLMKKGYRYRFHLNLHEDGLSDVFRLAGPILVSSWVQPICVTINMRFASFLGEGSIASLDYANKLYIILVGVFTFAITNYIFPSLSRMSGADDKEGFRNTIKTAFSAMLALIMPIAAGMALFSGPIVRVVYERGQFNQDSVATTATALAFFSLGMVGLGINEILNKGFYAMKDGKTPMYSAIWGIAVNVLLAYILFTYTPMGIGGLALAASISSIVIAVVLVTNMHKKIKFIDRDMLFTIFKIMIATLVMAIAAFGTNRLIAGFMLNKYIDIGITIGVGMLAYGAMLVALGVFKKMREI